MRHRTESPSQPGRSSPTSRRGERRAGSASPADLTHGRGTFRVRRRGAGASANNMQRTVYDVLVSAEGHLRAVAYYLYDWRLQDGSRVSFDCADVFNFDPSSGRIQSIVLVYDTHPVRGVVESKYP